MFLSEREKKVMESFSCFLQGPFNNGIRPLSVEEQKEVDSHWESVRKGNQKPETHEYKETNESVISMHRFLARKAIEEAARRMRIVEEMESE